MLKTELGVVRSNLTMMTDMMSQLDPVAVKQADMELLQVNLIYKYILHCLYSPNLHIVCLCH